MAAFVEMRKIHTQNAGLFQRLDREEQKQLEADHHFNTIFTALSYPRWCITPTEAKHIEHIEPIKQTHSTSNALIGIQHQHRKRR